MDERGFYGRDNKTGIPTVPAAALAHQVPLHPLQALAAHRHQVHLHPPLVRPPSTLRKFKGWFRCSVHCGHFILRFSSCIISVIYSNLSKAIFLHEMCIFSRHVFSLLNIFHVHLTNLK